MFETVIRGGKVWIGGDLLDVTLGLSGGKVAYIGAPIHEVMGEVEIDATGKWVLPGGIDTQVHFREPGLEHKEDLESGTRAAIHGGITTIFEMPNTNPATISAAALQDKLDRSKGRAWCDYGFFIGASPENVSQLAELEQLAGSPGVKIFVGSSTGSLLVEDDKTLHDVFRHGKRRCSLHSENEPRLRARKSLISQSPSAHEHPFLRDAEAAVISTKRIIDQCRITGRPVHILHISTADELPLLAAAKAEGLPVTCEVTPQHLHFAGPEDYDRLGTLLQMNPPVRDAHHRHAIWEALKCGLFDVFGSDHAPHTLEEKQLPYPQSPSGMPGVQTIYPIILDWVLAGRLSLGTVMRMIAERPAELFGIKGKGRLELGYDADLILFDPASSQTIRNSEMQSKCGWTPYDGLALSGRIEQVFLRGQCQVSSSQRVGTQSGKPAEYTWKASQ